MQIDERIGPQTCRQPFRLFPPTIQFALRTQYATFLDKIGGDVDIVDIRRVAFSSLACLEWKFPIFPLKTFVQAEYIRLTFRR